METLGNDSIFDQFSVEMCQIPVDGGDDWVADGCGVSVILGIDGVCIDILWRV